MLHYLLRFSILPVILFLIMHNSARSGLPQWQKISGPYGGKIISMMEDSDSSLYIQTHYYKFFKSVDQGRSWSYLNISHDTICSDIALLKNGRIAALGNKILFMSTDKGESWKYYDSLIYPFNLKFTSAVDDKDRLLFIDESGNVVRYDPAEKNLRVSGSLSFNPSQKKIFSDPSGCFFLPDPEKGLYYSTNSGLSWQYLRLEKSRLSTMAFMPGNSLIAGTDSNGVFISSDMGATWDHYTDGIQNRKINSLCTGSNGLAIAATDSGLYRSDDFGHSWRHDPGCVERLNTSAVFFNKSGDAFCCSDAGLYAASPGLSVWKESNQGIEANLYLSLYCPDKSRIFASTYYGLFITTDEGNHWHNTKDVAGFCPMGSIRGASKKIIVLAGNDRLMISTDLGASWKLSALDPDISTTPIIEIDSLGSFYYYFKQASDDSYACYKSTDDGQSWQPVCFNGITKLIQLAFKKDAIVLGSQNLVMISKDNGQRWDTVLSGKGYVYRVAVNSLGGIIVFRDDDNYRRQILVSSDNGLSWTDISKGLNKYKWDPYQIVSSAKGKLYASFTGSNFKLSGIFHNPCNDIWYTAGTGLPDERDFRHFNVPLAINNRYLFAGSPLKSIYRLPLVINSDVISAEITPDDTLGVSAQDRIDYVISVSGNGLPVAGADVMIIDGINNDTIRIKTNSEGSTYFSLIIKPGTHDGRYKVVFDVTADGFINNPVIESIINVNFTGVDEMMPQINNTIKLSPNPAGDLCHLEYSSHEIDLTRIGFYDMLGHKLAPDIMASNPGEIIINLQTVPDGLYYLRINDSGRTVIRALIVRH